MGRTAFLFPGQGSQAVGMGQDFYEAHAFAREIFALAEEITGRPLSRLCFKGPLEELTETVILQPAVTAVNLVCLKALAEKGLAPDLVAGHSLGEYSALAAAGVVSEADALRLVQSRGEVMQRAAEERPGAMQAVVGLSREEVEEIAERVSEQGVVVVANHNTAQQVVITGEKEAVAAAGQEAQEAGARVVPLPVSGAWHSPLMEEAAAEFAQVIAATDFGPPACEVVLNVTAAGEQDPERIKEILAQQITSPVRWLETIENMVAQGVTRFVEVGPGRVLSGLVKKIVPREAEVEIMNVRDQAGVDKATAALGD